MKDSLELVIKRGRGILFSFNNCKEQEDGLVHLSWDFMRGFTKSFGIF